MCNSKYSSYSDVVSISVKPDFPVDQWVSRISGCRRRLPRWSPWRLADQRFSYALPREAAPGMSPGFASVPSHDLYIYPTIIYVNCTHYHIATSVAFDYSPGGDTSCIVGGLLEQKPLAFKQKQRQPDAYATFVSQSLRECGNHSEYHRNP